MSKNEFEYAEIEIDLVDPSETNPRKSFDEGELNELVASVRMHGVLEPLIVRRVAGGRFEIVAGERRYRAGKVVGLGVVPAIVRDIDDVSMAEMQMVENIARARLEPLEESYGVTRLADLGRSKGEIAAALGRGKDWVQLRLELGELPEVAKAAMAEKKLGLDAAAQMLRLEAGEREAAAQSLLELGDALTNSEAKEVLRLRYMEPRARRKQWAETAAVALGKREDAVALEDCEQASDYLRPWGEAMGRWVKEGDAIAHAAKRAAEEGVTWGELSRQLGIKILMVPRGDVFRGEVEFLVDGKAVREVEAAARECGAPHTLGARKKGDGAGSDDDASTGTGAGGVDKGEGVGSALVKGSVDVTKNEGGVSFLAAALDVWEPGWRLRYECPLQYLLDSLNEDGSDEAEANLVFLLVEFFGIVRGSE